MAPKNIKPKRAAMPPQRNQSITGSSKPRLTHFLCLPLVNSTSIPQLVSSLAEFRDSIPLVAPPVSTRVASSAQLPHAPLLPDGALRPLGTLHLTLGVMSLPTKQRLDEALEFLQALDLKSMLRDAGIQAGAGIAGTGSIEDAAAAAATPDALLQPLLINLTSLHALPRAKAATILHAQPVDSTARLYPFCVSLRNKFIEAGFIEQEMIKDSPRSKIEANRSSNRKNAGGSDPEGSNGNHDDDNENNNIIGPAPLSTSVEETAASSTGKVGKPRPLLLHATIANTVYLPRRRGHGKRKETLKFDARELLMDFGEYVPPVSDADSRNQEDGQSRNQNFLLEVEEDEVVKVVEEVEEEDEARGKHKERQKPPFVWAKNIPIDRVCICEMGAKPVPNDGAKGGPVLGEAYVSVGERSLVFEQQAGGDRDGDGDDDDNGDGGVRVV
ncbi:hypothetical protein AJ78_02522 [Emergomyces pasteurianus Ep9510]|uniref:A-kinase anchor protein 7-like phosphoesterase domain-containing protein n=1 Tax=Emergomyces pasteurianus Ep9510 TaxID=1447872 RepID=A0A1J9PLJ9_9EURO|nr:hypothetical protein AJ78_02522 [Emergomyces pasteurianus Ep9510]